MELHQLRYVVAVAATGNFSRAAERCHISQPSLSQQILKLEEELGERLFDRMKRTVRLTSSGEALLFRASKILEEVEMAKREASEAKKLLRGTLTIGALPTIAPYLLPPALSVFMKKFPGVEIIVHEDTTQRLLKLALSCEIDFAFASCPIVDERMFIRELFTEELLLALPPGHRLTKKRIVKAHELQGERLIVMKDGHCLGEQALGFCDQRELRTKIGFRSAQLETIQNLVQANLGISLIPTMAATRTGNVAPQYRSLEAPHPERKIVAAWPKQRPLGRTATEFMKEIQLRPGLRVSGPAKARPK